MDSVLREIDSSIIEEKVFRMCIDANIYLPGDIKQKICVACEKEDCGLPLKVMDIIRMNYLIAEEKQIPVCQDTGMACFFIEVGQDVHVNGNLTEAVNRGVCRGYTEGFLRKSVVEPLHRINTKDNTPALIHYDIVSGDKIKIFFAPKGFGSENMCKVAMLKPSDGVEGVIDFVVNTVRTAGSKPCPPIVLGVGIGGNFDIVTYLSKKALFRNTDIHNPDEYYASLEKTLLEKVNELYIGPQGVGGNTTALAVNIEYMPTHIAGLPVAVSVGCHATRHLSCII